MTADLATMTGFTYTTYIQATPEQVWRGLTDPAITKRYWRHHRAGAKTFLSDWKKGSTYDLVHEKVGLVVSDPEQVILESDHCHRLAYTWHTFTPEWAAANGTDEDTVARLAAEPRSAVTFDIAPAESGVVKLTVVHGRLDADGILRDMISGGWPRLLSGLKTLLETGRTLTATA
jgi:uncharacterized protein YndB with AHSA1/START domain